MTRERRMAVQMWCEIAQDIRDGKITYFWTIKVRKIDFAFDHKVRWHCTCWFCHYIRHCHECPLAQRFGDSPCQFVPNPYAELEVLSPYVDGRDKLAAERADCIADILEGK